MRPAKSPSEEIRIGVLGAGSVVESYHLPVLRNMPNVIISWLVDRAEERAQRLARAYGVSKVYTRIEECADVDIVLVAIPVGHRRELLRHIFQRRWNVLCEKPFATSLAEHDAILEQASASGVQIGVGLMRRYYRANILAKQLIQDGGFGNVHEVWANEGTRMRGTGREEGWYQAERTAAGGGVLLETGSHLVDQVFTILRVREFRIQDSCQYLSGGVDLEARATSIVIGLDGREVTFTLAISRMNDLYNGIVIRLSDGMLKLGLFPNDDLLLCTQDGRTLGRLNGDIGAGHTYQAFYLEWQDFIRQCISSHASAISAETARQSTAFIEKCYRDARSLDVRKSDMDATKA